MRTNANRPAALGVARPGRSTAPRWPSCGSPSGPSWSSARSGPGAYGWTDTLYAGPDPPVHLPLARLGAPARTRRHPGARRGHGAAGVAIALGWRTAAGVRRAAGGVRVDRADRRHHLPQPLLVRHPRWPARRGRPVRRGDEPRRPPARRLAGRSPAAGCGCCGSRSASSTSSAGIAKLQRRLAGRRPCRCGSGCPARADLPGGRPRCSTWPSTAHVLVGRRRRVRLPRRARCCCGGGPGRWRGSSLVGVPRRAPGRCSRSACSRG